MEMLVRRPLQPKNLNSIPRFSALPKKPKKLNQKTITVSVSQLTDHKETSEKTHQIEIEANKKRDEEFIRELSLAEELEIARKRKERLRLEREKTERLLKERDLVLDSAMKVMEMIAEEQSNLELEIYKVVLLKDLRSSSMRVYPIQSLREKEEAKKRRETQSEEICAVKSMKMKEQEEEEIESQSEESTSGELEKEVCSCSSSEIKE